MGKMVAMRIKNAAGERVQLQQRRNGFNERRQQTFLETLAITSNVMASARAAKVCSSTVYRHRRASPGFHNAWMTALEEGYERLELMLLDRAIRYNRFVLGETVGEVGGEAGGDGGSDADGAPEKAPVAVPFSNGEAMRLLKMHRDSVQLRRAQVAALVIEKPADLQAQIEEELIAISHRLLDKIRDADDAAH